MEPGIYLMLPTEDEGATSNSDLRLKLSVSVGNGTSWPLKTIFKKIKSNLNGER